MLKPDQIKPLELVIFPTNYVETKNSFVYFMLAFPVISHLTVTLNPPPPMFQTPLSKFDEAAEELIFLLMRVDVSI